MHELTLGVVHACRRADLWKLDIGSSSWKMLAKEDKSDPTKPTPAAFNAFCSLETTDLVPAHSGATSTLTNNVHTLYFTAKTVTWIKLWTSCDDNIMSSEPVCPEPRRDMALSIMGNEGGENGRLLVFGGAGGASQNPQSELYYEHGMKGYLDGATNSINFKAFDDLW